MGVQSSPRGPNPLNSKTAAAAELHRHLSGLDALAARTLKVESRDDAATFYVDVAGERVPLFRVTPDAGGGVRLSVRQGGRWQVTPEHGSPASVAKLLAGPLRFVWHLDAEDAEGSEVEDL